MKFRLAWLLLLWSALLPAQTPEVEITSEPCHHQVLVNPYIRVFRVEIAPHAATLLHRHVHDYFFVTLEATNVSNQVAGKPPVTLNIQEGETRFVEGNFAHVAHNLSDHPFRNILIEFLKDAEARAHPPQPWDEDRALHIHMKGTQDVLFVKDGVRVSDFQLQPGGMVHNQYHPGPRLIVAVTGVDLNLAVRGKSSQNIQLKSGEVQWLAGGDTEMLMNAGKNSARWITLEFH
jgi:quercetin dioxygenase-like cupin family protein